MKMTRREITVQIGSLLLAASPTHAGMSQKRHAPWLEFTWRGRKVFRQREAGRVVVLLHEINGLSRSCVEFGQELCDRGFQVYMPLLFGHFDQDEFVLGFMESCGFGHFHCYALGENLLSGTGPVEWVQAFVNHLESNSSIDSIGVIGMCQSGAFPIATMKPNSKVRAVVLSQPALPFGKSRQSDVGLSKSLMETARKSRIPILAFRFEDDTLCTASRFNFLEKQFDGQQFHPVTFHHCDCKQTFTHRCHAVLTGKTEDVRTRARAMVKDFFEKQMPNSKS